MDFVSEEFTAALNLCDSFKNVRQESFFWSVAAYSTAAHVLGTITLFPCLNQPWDSDAQVPKGAKHRAH